MRPHRTIVSRRGACTLSGGVRLTRWQHDEPPSEAELLAALVAAGMTPYRWSNSPGERYAPHAHASHKVVYVVTDSITFQLHPGGTVALGPGDRLDLPAGATHSAVVGPEGVVSLEGHRATSPREWTDTPEMGRHEQSERDTSQ
ncbi:MAG: cupin [Thermomicrobium sp.]|nr:cupin [Thermomicrobium sp.]